MHNLIIISLRLSYKEFIYYIQFIWLINNQRIYSYLKYIGQYCEKNKCHSNHPLTINLKRRQYIQVKKKTWIFIKLNWKLIQFLSYSYLILKHFLSHIKLITRKLLVHIFLLSMFFYLNMIHVTISITIHIKSSPWIHYTKVIP